MDLSEKLLGRGENLASKIYGIAINCVIVLLIVALFAVLIVTNMFALCRVDGDSMNPTLVTTQFVLVEKHKTEIKRGDVIVFRKGSESTQYIKRAMAVGGDTFEFVTSVITDANGQKSTVADLYVNGVKQEDDFEMKVSYWRPPYASQIGLKLDTEYTVPDGQLLALGDNRNNSMDSRYSAIGFVDCETELLGRADVFLEIGSFTEWLIEMIYGVPFKSEYNVKSS